MSRHFYITTPIYYVNDKPHIGHAYTSIACDALARFKRLDGYDVHFLTGTDEHGQKVEKSAITAGVTPQEFVDMVSESFRELTEELNLSNDGFIRTTEPRHIMAAQAMWDALIAQGDIYLGSYAGWYSVRDEAFYAEDELVNGFAPTGAPVEWVEEPSYFFRLSAWQERLLAFYEAHPDFIQPEGRRNEVISFVKGGLHDLSVSRTTFGWGVPVPNAPEHVMYVWLDALTNYLTELGYPDMHNPTFTNFWRSGETIHVVGKDILRFHTVYWPAFLMSAGVPVVDRVFAHGWWTNEGQKISKSIGNVIKPVQLIETYGLDATRYFLLREVPFGNDGNFSSMAMVQRINSELANTLGNLAQRTLAMVQKHVGGCVPSNTARIEAVDAPIEAAIYDLIDKVRPAMEGLKFHYALELMMELGRLLNEYIDAQAPWNLRKTDVPRMEAVLYVLMEGLRCLGICLQPFVPRAASLWLDQLGVAEDARLCSHASAQHCLRSGATVPEPQPIFPRFEV
ncbi:MAG: methionine--tRNA ligase [Alphaproteobacteria bacterium]|nr:MAG: methionine--tRNA ligase [Alphaproteobacteria bacterium]